jgi:N-acetylglucosaminyldiphosphoundecaprenol N-acetyl-beta-D-mannosaminyltransferase
VGDRIEMLGCPIDALDMSQTIARCRRLIEAGGPAQHVAVNAAKLVAMQDDPRLREIVHGCDVISADGQSVVWASRLQGKRLPARVAGIDLMQELLRLAEHEGYRVFVLGARREVLEQAIGKFRSRYPRLEIAGYRDGYFGESESDAVCAEIRAARADILLVAISSPRKEYWLASNLHRVDVRFAMGVGGAIDVIAGVTRRAPRVVQQLGLEWLFRLGQEPRRLFARYAVTNVRFLVAVQRELVRSRLVRSRV